MFTDEWLQDVCVECSAALANWMVADDPARFKILSAEGIARGVSKLAASIVRWQPPTITRLVFIPILKASFMFAADLIRAYSFESGVRTINTDTRIHFVRAASYEGQSKSARVEVDLMGIENWVHVIDPQKTALVLVDTIYDTGDTLTQVWHELRKAFSKVRGQPSIFSAVLLQKKKKKKFGNQSRLVANMKFGFRIPDFFVVGYGTDVDGAYRELPDLWIMRPEN